MFPMKYNHSISCWEESCESLYWSLNIFLGLMHVEMILVASASVRFYVLVHIIEIVVELLHPVWFSCGCEHQLVPVVPVVNSGFPTIRQLSFIQSSLMNTCPCYP